MIQAVFLSEEQTLVWSSRTYAFILLAKKVVGIDSDVSLSGAGGMCKILEAFFLRRGLQKPKGGSGGSDVVLLQGPIKVVDCLCFSLTWLGRLPRLEKLLRM